MKFWYVVQLTAGYEENIKKEIQRRIIEHGMEDAFGDIIIPSAKLVNQFAGQEASIEQLFPGYMLVQLIPSPEAFRLITTINRVVRILGGENPLPLEEEEVSRIMEQMSGSFSIKKKVTSFEIGTEVSIASGPFAGFSGVISSIDEVKQRFVIMVSIFGRSTPVEINFDQVTV